MTLWTWAVPASADSMLTIRLVQLALAATAAYIVDDAAAALTSVAPRSRWLHRAFPLTTGLATIAVAWVVVLINLRRGPDAMLRSLTIEVAVLVLMALAASSMLAMRGEPEPGNQVAIALPLVGVGALVFGGMLGFEVFMSGHGPGQAERETAWVICLVLAAAVLVWASRDDPA
jgi:uncharacterized protein YhhL (DUF1145 family)